MPQTIFGRRKVTSTAPVNCLNPLRHPRHMTSVSSLALMLGAAGLVGTTLSANAADVTWNGAISTNWFDPGNWTPGAVPDATNFVNINMLTPNPTVISGAGATGLVVFVGRNAGDVGSLKIVNGGTLSDSQGSVGRFAGSNGTVTVDGVGSAWLHADDFYVGAEGTGTVSILNGGLISNVRGILGDGDDAFAVMSVDGAGSTWTNSSTLAVARFGTGVLNVSNGGTVSDTDGSISKGTASNGTVSIDGAGSTWTNSGSLIVGDFGTGTLTITHGGTVSNSWATIGAKAGSTGMVFVDGAGSTWTNSSNLGVGDFGSGTLAITNGGAVSNDTAYVGNSAGSNGMVSVAGTGSSWTSADLYVGGLSTGTLSISSGGAVSSDTAYVGYGPASTGMVFVDGPGSTWTNSSNLFVADQGTGALMVSNSGKVSNQSGIVGHLAGSTGMAAVDGVGSVWTNNSSLTVGAEGTGTLAISNGGTVISAAGYLSFDPGSVGTATVSGAGSTWTTGLLAVGQRGTGSLIVSNGGKVISTDGFVGGSAGSVGMASISGTNSTWANSGNLNVGGFGPGTLTIANGGTVSAGGVVDIAALASSVGTLNIGAPSGSPAAAAGTLNAASVQFGPGAGTINFNHTDTNYTFASAIGGLGTINQIAGMTNLTADSSGFTGATNVTGGQLAVNGSLANSLVTISGGMLGGNGTVGGIVAQSGGIIAPGNSIGTLNVAGNIDQAAGSIYQVELTSTGQSDLLLATGAAAIAAGAILDVIKTDAAPYVLGTHYTVLQADDGVSGTYTLNGAGPFIGLIANYDATHVYLDVVQAKSFADVGLTPNQIATGSGAESLGSGNSLYDAILASPSEATAQAAFDQVSGEIHASAKGMLLEDSRFIRDAATNRVDAAFGDAGAEPMPVMAYGEGGPEMVAADTDRFAVWGQAFGSWGNIDSDGNAATFGRSTGGLLAGADGLVGDWRVGLIGGYSHSSFDVDDRHSGGDADSYHVGLYGGTNWGAIAFRTGAAYSWNSISTKRSVAFNGFADQLSADYDAGTAQVFGEFAYKADAGRFRFEPFANLAYVSVHTNGLAEKGSAAALTSAGSTANATFTTLGLRASTDVALGGISATARGTLGWRHAFGDVTPTSIFAFAGGDTFTIAGVPVARDSAVIEAGVDLQMSTNATLGLSYVGQFGAHSTDNGAKANLNVKF